MTIKQTFLKLLYPLISKLSGLIDKDSLTINKGDKKPIVSFYSLKATLSNKTPFEFRGLKGKKVMLVNIASNCGFTAQYKELEALSKMYDSKLVVLGFPANDFKGQEPGSDEEIESFCKINYGVSFPIFTKASVIKPAPQEVFDWLASKDKNGWNSTEPSWNFCKYLVDEKGNLVAIFKPSVSPLDEKITKLIDAPVL